MSSLQAEDDDLVPLGDALEDVQWTRAVKQARIDIDKAMGLAQISRDPIDFVDAEDLIAADYGPTPWIVDGIATENAVMVVAGEPKTAKTWAAFEIAVALATDTPAFGEFKVHNRDHRGVFCFCCEDDSRGVKNRLRSLVAGRGPVTAGWGRRLKVKTLGALKLNDLDHVATYVATVRESGMVPIAVMFDPLRDLHTANEDNSSEMAAIMGALRAIRTVLGCTVLFVHHSKKAAGDGRQVRGGQAMRGSSAIHGAVDCGMYMTLQEGENTREKTTMNSGVEGEMKAAKSLGLFSLSLEIFDNAQGEAIRSQWTFSRGSAEGKASAEADRRNRDKILTLVRKYHAKAAFVPVSIRQMKADLSVSGAKYTVLRETLAAMVADNELEALPGAQGAPVYRLPVGGGAKVLPIRPAEVPESVDDPDPDEDDFGPTDY